MKNFVRQYKNDIRGIRGRTIVTSKKSVRDLGSQQIVITNLETFKNIRKSILVNTLCCLCSMQTRI